MPLPKASQHQSDQMETAFGISYRLKWKILTHAEFRVSCLRGKCELRGRDGISA